MIAAIAREHLRSSCVEPGHAHGMLDSLGAAVREEDVGEGFWRSFGDETSGLAADVVGVLRGDGAEAVGLGLDRLDHRRVLVADVGVDQLARQIEELVAVVVVDIAARCPGDRHRRDEGLGGP